MNMLWAREPAMLMAVIQSLIALVIAFGLKLSAVQVGAILAFTAAVLGLITRTQVSPISSDKPTV